MGTGERDEFAYYTPEAKAGILHIRGLEDKLVLEAARDRSSEAFGAISRFMGPKTNPFWIAAEAAAESYRRGLIDEVEFDYLTR